jgi:hypothetical protein
MQGLLLLGWGVPVLIGKHSSFHKQSYTKRERVNNTEKNTVLIAEIRLTKDIKHRPDFF